MNDCEKMLGVISAYIDGELSGDEARAAEAHLASCASCREAAEEWRAATAEAREVPSPSGLEWDMMWRRIERHTPLFGRWQMIRRRAWRIGVAAAIAATVLVAAVLLYPRAAALFGEKSSKFQVVSIEVKSGVTPVVIPPQDGQLPVIWLEPT